MVMVSSLFISANPAGYPKHHFNAYIIQDGKQLSIDQHVVKVKRAPFQIIVDMPDKKGVFVSASFFRDTFKQALRNVSSNDLPGFSKEALFELWKNPNNELLVSSNNPNFWFIETPANHRFSSYEYVNNRYLCSRTVDFIYDIDMHKNKSLANMDMSLYLTFIKFEPDEENYRSKELMRHEFKIEWVD
jgi:hypothetical protein